MLRVIAEQFSVLLVEPTRLRIPAERADVLASIYRFGKVLTRAESNGAIELTARLPAKLKVSLSDYIRA